MGLDGSRPTSVPCSSRGWRWLARCAELGGCAAALPQADTAGGGAREEEGVRAAGGVLAPRSGVRVGVTVAVNDGQFYANERPAAQFAGPGSGACGRCGTSSGFSECWTRC